LARVLIVGCGCRGRALAGALLADGLAVRGTSRTAAGAAAVAGAGAEAAVADPDRLAGLVPHLAGVSVVCWLLGSATGPGVEGLHGRRLATLLEHLVDTPVRGFVYEASGTAPAAARGEGRRLVSEAGERWRLRVAIVEEPPVAHAAWLAASAGAVRELLG
jgi:uncharacterized protein YbjT (DUF2867 family)